MLEERAILREKPPGLDRLQRRGFSLCIAERRFEHRCSQALVRPQVCAVGQHVGHMDSFS